MGCKEKTKGRKRKKRSLQKKLALAFFLIILAIMSVTILLHFRTLNIMYRMTYEKMEVHANYYQQTFEAEIEHVLDLQIEFFNDRKLPFLAGSEILMNDYEKRDTLLSVQERIRSMTGISDLVEDGILYIPKSGYYITPETVGKMEQKDYVKMEEAIGEHDSSLLFDGENFFSVRTGENRMIISDNPNFVFVLTFSSSQVEELLYLLSTSDDGGAFIYNEKENTLLEGASSGNRIGKQILSELKMDEYGTYQKTQKVKVGEKSYLAFAGSIGELGLFVQYDEEAPIIEYMKQSWVYTGLFLGAMTAASVVFILYTKRIIHKPLHALIQAFERIKQGNLEEYIERNENDEFTYLYEGFNEMERRRRELVDEIYVQRNLVQKAQLKQLQAQINPHFLYNSFFTLSRRIKRQDYEGAEELAKHLGNYFKYITRDGSDVLPLYQEVEHARSYAAIQAGRFVDRLNIQFDDLLPEYADVLVPRLILQPLLENSLEHGVENKVKDGLIHVAFSAQDGEMQILVEDNGEEADEETISAMQHALEETNLDEVTGMVNIHRRLKIYFKGNAGLRIKRSRLGGAAVIIFIREVTG